MSGGTSGTTAGGHLPGAVNFEFPCPEPCDLTRAQQEAFAKLLGPDKGRPIVFSCEFTRCGRSHNGGLWARTLGYTNVFRHPGGLKAWRQADLPSRRGDEPAGCRRALSAGGVAGLLLLFLAVLGFGIAQGLDVECGCLALGGDRGSGGLKAAFARDVLMLAGVGWCFRRRS